MRQNRKEQALKRTAAKEKAKINQDLETTRSYKAALKKQQAEIEAEKKAEMESNERARKIRLIENEILKTRTQDELDKENEALAFKIQQLEARQRASQTEEYTIALQRNEGLKAKLAAMELEFS